MNNIGERMYALVCELFPICRSITGDGFRKSLAEIKKIIPDIVVHEIPSGEQVFDWSIPKEWNIRDAYIETLDGKRIIDFHECNLHVLGYSIPVNMVVTKSQLLEHIYTQPEQPDWIPYVTSYYKERWGFCMSEKKKAELFEDEYHVVIDSELKNGSLTYGDLLIPGESEDEILFSTYLCHPSMANNELSGPALVSELVRYIQTLNSHRYSYRFVIIPETIGSITYCSKNLLQLQQNVKAGFVLSCVGDNRTYSYISTKYGDTLADKVAKNVLKFHYPDYKAYSFLSRGSDERQYGAPGVDLPVCGICRSKYHEYPEYHTSADNLNLISPEGLSGAYNLMVKIINALEYNKKYQVVCKCEPQLGKRGLYPTISQKNTYDSVTTMCDFLAYADGTNDIISISNIIEIPIDIIIPIVDKLLENKLIKIAN